MSLSLAILFLLQVFVFGSTASGISEGLPDLRVDIREELGDLRLEVKESGAQLLLEDKMEGTGAPNLNRGSEKLRGVSSGETLRSITVFTLKPEMRLRRGGDENGKVIPEESTATSPQNNSMESRHFSTTHFQITSRIPLSSLKDEGAQTQDESTGRIAGEQRNEVETTAERLQLESNLYSVTDTTYSAYAVVLLSLILFIVGNIGNLAVMCIVCHNYYMKSAWNNILAGLACWDFFVIFFCLPVVVFNEITKKRLLGDIGCKVVPYLEVSCLGVTTFSLCALSIDRFRSATTIQSQIRLIESCLSIVAKMAVIWIGSMLLALPEVLLWQLDQKTSIISGVVTDYCIIQTSSNLPDHIYGLALTYENSRMWWYFGCYFCLPIIFSVTCQLVTRRVKSTENKSDVKTTSKFAHYESQRNYTLIGLTILYGCCIIPENICNIVVAYTIPEISKETIDLLNIINQFFLFFKSSVTPVLVLCLWKPLGHAFMNCCCCCCDECSPEPSGTDVHDSKMKMEMASIFCDNPKETSAMMTLGTQR
ncbi:G-protein coupled receptor 37-like 1 isoform X1 [Hypanus sabinus]|uniref:G-protein coupled receptor 37-like 1 isoform X1 n=1 Tax=Hypanus sabinus TaxID=79690 RepID=UPI0028C398FE|nr:G-protein coupled receptor 37-like 1 isoform X1 [Hypanus sabinus]